MSYTSLFRIGIFYTVAPCIEVYSYTYLTALSWNGTVFITFYTHYNHSNQKDPPPLCSINVNGPIKDFPPIVDNMVKYKSDLQGGKESKETVVLYLSW